MNLTFEKELYIKRIIFASLIFIAAVFQNTGGALPVIGSAHAFVLLPLTVSIAMNEKSIPSMIFGIFAGTLWDFASPSIDGYYAILFCVIAFSVSMLVNFLMRNNIFTALLLSFTSIAAVTVLNWFFFIVMKKYDLAVYALTNYYIPSAIYTFIFTPFCYYTAEAVSRKFKTDRRALS